MNPLYWRGPAFLLFYAVVAGLIAAGLWLYSRRGSDITPKLSELTQDPYLIAALRGGAREMILVAIFNLVDRGFLGLKGNAVQALRAHDASMLRRPVDRVLLSEALRPVDLLDLAQRPAVTSAAEKYEDDLRRRGLLLDAAGRFSARAPALVAAAGLAALAVAKITIALRTGHSNVEFLGLLALVAVVSIAKLGKRRATPLGLRTLDAAGALFKRLRGSTARLAAGGATNDALFLACTFGVGALPQATFPFLPVLFPKRAQGGDTSGGSSCGTSSSSCGSSSCGSSGCGGGGGCGGCGS